MAITSHWHEEATHHTSKKLPKTEPKKKTQTFPDTAFKLDFDSHLDRFRRQRYQECAQNGKGNTTVSEGRAKVKNGVSIAGLAGDRKKRKINAT